MLTKSAFGFVHDNEVTATITPDAEQGAFVVGALLGQFDRLFSGLDRFAIDFLDDIAGFQASFGSRGIRRDVCYNDTVDGARQIKLLTSLAVQVPNGYPIERAVVVLIATGVVILGEPFLPGHF